jgi:hypothetical protein
MNQIEELKQKLINDSIFYESVKNRYPGESNLAYYQGRINQAADIIDQLDKIDLDKIIQEHINDNIWEIIRNNIDTAKEIVLN